MKRTLILLFLISLTQVLFAQKTGDNEIGAWYMYFGTHKVNEKYSIHTEAQLRLYEPVSNFFQLLPRLGFNYHINSYSTLTAGYALIPSSSFDKTEDLQITSLENRIWQQFVLKNFIGRVKFYHRYRFEQRWIESNSPENVTSNKYLSRLRYFIKLLVPLNNDDIIEKTVYLAAYNEIFMNLSSAPFDQNRLYFALGYNLSKNICLETGYQSRWTPSSRYDLLQFSLFLKSGFN